MRPTTEPRGLPRGFSFSMGPMRLPKTPLDLLDLDLPRGEPWGYAFAQSLLKAPWAWRALRPTPGLLQLIRQDLEVLSLELEGRRREYPLADLGERPPHPAEEGALAALLTRDPEALARVLQAHGPYPFALYRAFRFAGEVRPLERYRLPREDELLGYEEQLKALRANALRFLSGKPALHTLLYGARGTGKSTAAKSLLHLREARMVEVEPKALAHLEDLLERLTLLPHRFFLFLDDLSLDPEGEAFHHLKALLEGSLEGPPENVLLLATSNRRHLVRQTGENPLPGADPTAWDELQDTLALSERFGLVLTFPPFDKTLYLKAVAHHLGRSLSLEEEKEALRFALQKGFSGRVARQFALSLL
ncbi:AAA+ family ATPase [Thermus scotoductus]|uniref:AAA+ family ATPase n=2 Tax=Thermus scotoductus TaxID=37636 RepID=A0A430RHF9_THESC|nr:AAA+ family ATPase [Thermus scotoductus]